MMGDWNYYMEEMDDMMNGESRSWMVIILALSQLVWIPIVSIITILRMEYSCVKTLWCRFIRLFSKRRKEEAD